MTPTDVGKVLEALHNLELRMVEKVTRLEGKIDGIKTLTRRVDQLEGEVDNLKTGAAGVGRFSGRDIAILLGCIAALVSATAGVVIAVS